MEYSYHSPITQKTTKKLIKTPSSILKKNKKLQDEDSMKARRVRFSPYVQIPKTQLQAPYSRTRRKTRNSRQRPNVGFDLHVVDEENDDVSDMGQELNKQNELYMCYEACQYEVFSLKDAVEEAKDRFNHVISWACSSVKKIFPQRQQTTTNQVAVEAKVVRPVSQSMVGASIASSRILKPPLQSHAGETFMQHSHGVDLQLQFSGHMPMDFQ